MWILITNNATKPSRNTRGDCSLQCQNTKMKKLIGINDNLYLLWVFLRSDQSVLILRLNILDNVIVFLIKKVWSISIMLYFLMSRRRPSLRTLIIKVFSLCLCRIWTSSQSTSWLSIVIEEEWLSRYQIYRVPQGQVRI